MEPKKVLGLDLGTNSIGWALVEHDEIKKSGKILGAGTRILPMSQDQLGKFDSGQSISQTAERTAYRGIRRLRERHLLRRERLHRVLNILSFLPEHYAIQIDFTERLGKFVHESEPKIAYRFNEETKQAEFIFQSSFKEMLEDFRHHQPTLVTDGKKVPYDWTIYYLRKKALTQKIDKEELAWLLLNFNLKRGYYQLRGEEEDENTNKSVEFFSLKVTKVEATEDKKGADRWYNVYLENGWIYRRSSKVPLDWTGKTKDFIVTTDLNDDGTVKKNKEGQDRRSFRAPAEDDWTLLKKKTEHDIETSGKTVGAYIYDALLQKPTQKIRGKLVRVVERKFYKQELELILNKQQQFHPELQNPELYKACLNELYQYNEAHKNSIAQKGFVHLFTNDIIFYQRPLKSKKSLISNCSFEYRTFTKDGHKEIEPLKCIAKSHPLFQEFRLWQFIQNLKIYQREKQVGGQLQTDVNVTKEFLTSEGDIVQLFDWLNDKQEINQDAFLRHFKLKADKYRWNYVEDKEKKYPCNETRALILSRLRKVNGIEEAFLSKESEEQLWHILYSVEDKDEIKKALKKFAEKKSIRSESVTQFVEEFSKFPTIKKEYGSYSAKAIKKLLSLMRAGKYWSESAIDINTKQRIDNILSGEYDANIKDRVRDKAIHLSEPSDFKGLPLWLASYIIYDRHSEATSSTKWKTVRDVQLLQQHSLRNPIVEQVINETLQVVKEIWKHYGNGQESFFDEIHVELGREMKNPAAKRKEMSSKISENEATNLRIKALLQELLNDKEVENVRPYSPTQQEILKIYEEGVLMAAEDVPEYITKISKQAQPSQSDLIRYKLWLQQKYRSPYTGEMIPLNKLFTRAYDIEHIIPQSRYFDDSMSNKVICEVEVNRDKENCTAYEYIKNNSGKKVELSHGKEVTLFTTDQYEDFIKRNYASNRGKMKKLLMEDIPEEFIQRQLNDSRHISKVVKGLLSNIVREENEAEATSKNVIASNGAITSALKQDWGLNDVWNEIITPRFERLNALTNSSNFGEWVNKEGKRVFQVSMPLDYQRGFSKKRIDHRHHALDAIVIACASRSHINYLNNQSALEKGKTKEQKEKLRYDLKAKLCFKKYNDDKNYKWVFYKPWETFTQEVRNTLETMVVSFKQNLRVINKTSNHYQRWEVNIPDIKKKITHRQLKGESWAIRKPLHKETVAGQVYLKFKKTVSFNTALDNMEMIVDSSLRTEISNLYEQHKDKKKLLKYFKEQNNTWKGIDISKVEVYYWDIDENGTPKNVASRTLIDESFSSDKIQSITDTGIQKIMLNHLIKFNETKDGKIIEHPALAFSPDRIDEMNKKIVELNDGKLHQPIYKVRTYEPVGNKFPVGETGNKKKKYVEAAKGTNLFFAIYEDVNGKRSFETVPLNIVIERLKQGLSEVPEKSEAGHNLKFFLSPNDLIYLPTKDELGTQSTIVSSLSKEQLKRLYKVVSFTGNRLYAIPHTVAKAVLDKVEFTQLNKLEFTIDEEKQSIKEVCIKIRTDRIGRITLNQKNIASELGSTFVRHKTNAAQEPSPNKKS